MIKLVIFVAQFGLLLSSATFAFATGGQAERRGAIWFLINYLIGTGLGLVGWNSPTATLILDGVYATGLLPLAIIYVSWWVGAMALLAAAAFSLEAVYLIQDLPANAFYLLCTNGITVAIGLVFLASGAANWLRRRRLRPIQLAGAKAEAAI